MRAIDVMVRDIVTVHPDTDVADAVKLLSEHDISALPVVDESGNLIGMLSEADLIHRSEIGTEKHRPWWQEAVTGASTLAEEFAKSHGKKVGEVMTDGVITVTEDTPLSEIAALFERKRIKRVPVVKDGKLVGTAWISTTKRTAKSGLSCCLDSKTNRGPGLATETLRLATESCISGGLSARRWSVKRCSRLPRASPGYPGYPGFPTK
jgi:CBS domain-containing protein